MIPKEEIFRFYVQYITKAVVRRFSNRIEMTEELSLIQLALYFLDKNDKVVDDHYSYKRLNHMTIKDMIRILLRDIDQRVERQCTTPCFAEQYPTIHSTFR